MFLLRETPYITMADIRRVFFPKQKSKGYSLEMTGVLIKNRLIEKHMIGDGVFIYYLTSEALRIVDFFLIEEPKFHPKTKSFYFSKPPRTIKEVSPFFFFPGKRIAYKLFSPHQMHQHPYHHTLGLLEIYLRFRQQHRTLFVLWLDHLEAKHTALNVPFNPDLLLTNDPFTEANRIYVEFENSSIQARNLVAKVNNISTMPADWFFVICSSQEILLNFGRIIRRVLHGDAKSHQKTLFFTPRAQAVLSRNLVIGLWRPSHLIEGDRQNFRSLELFRYDHETFDKTIWVNIQDKGLPVMDPHGKVPLKRAEPVPYPARKPGQRKYLLGEILDNYSTGYKNALQKIVRKGSPSDGPGSGKGELQ